MSSWRTDGGWTNLISGAVVHTPGHTHGSISLRLDDGSMLWRCDSEPGAGLVPPVVGKRGRDAVERVQDSSIEPPVLLLLTWPSLHTTTIDHLCEQ